MRPDQPVWNMSNAQLTLLLFVAAVATGFVGAVRFAFTAGFDLGYGSEPKIVFSGIVLGVLALALYVLVAKVIRAVILLLAGATTRPGLAASLTLIICGTVCLIATVVLALWRASSGVQVAQVGGHADFAIYASGSILSAMLTIVALLVGSGMVAIGIWSSMAPDTAPPRGSVTREEELVAIKRAD